MALWVLAGDRCEVSEAGGLVWRAMQIWLRAASLLGAATKCGLLCVRACVHVTESD